jgi:hypothetical protein
MNHTRPFISVDKLKWCWLKLPKTNNLKLPLNIGIPHEISSLLVVRYFSVGGDGRVFVGLDLDQRRLRVVKLFRNDTSGLSQLEHDLWLEIWGVETITCTLAGNEALVMPLVFTAKEDGTFAISPNEWAYNHGSVADGDELAFNRIFEQTSICLSNRPWSVAEAQAEALAAMEAAGYTHDDMKLQHVALLPELDAAGNISALRPVLIDLARVSKLVR